MKFHLRYSIYNFVQLHETAVFIRQKAYVPIISITLKTKPSPKIVPIALTEAWNQMRNNLFLSISHSYWNWLFIMLWEKQHFNSVVWYILLNTNSTSLILCFAKLGFFFPFYLTVGKKKKKYCDVNITI